MPIFWVSGMTPPVPVAGNGQEDAAGAYILTAGTPCLTSQSLSLNLANADGEGSL